MSPDESENLTTIIAPQGDAFVVLRSPEDAEHHPDYRELASFAKRAQAEAFAATAS